LQLIVGFGSIGSGKTIGLERLKLDGIGARLDRHIDERACELQIAIVIHTSLSDHKHRLPRPDYLIRYLNRLH